MFSQVCVNYSVHREGCAWQGVCVARGACMVWEGMCMTGGGTAWQGGMHGRWGEGSCMAGEMATAVDGTHPTGRHSCFNVKSHCLTLEWNDTNHIMCSDLK